MSIVTRVFIVLTLIMSVFFLAHIQQLYHVQENFKAELKLSEKNLGLAKEALNQNQRDSQASINALKQQLIERDHRSRNLIEQISEKDRLIAQLEADKRDLQSKYQDASDQLTDSLASTSQIQTRIQELESKTENLRKSNDSVQEQLELAMDNAGHEEQLKITYREQVVDLKNQLRNLESDLAVARINLQAFEDNYGPMDPINALPIIKAKIRGVGPNQEIVVIGAGTDQQVKPGYVFNIRRGNSFIGKARVDSVSGEHCTAIIMKEFLKGEIRQFDDVSTR